MTANTMLTVSLKNTKADLFAECEKLSAEKALLVEAVEKLTRDNEALQVTANENIEKVAKLTTVCNDYKAELDDLRTMNVSDDTTDEAGMPRARLDERSVALANFSKRMGIRLESDLWGKAKLTQDHDRFVLWFDSQDWNNDTYKLFGRLRVHARIKGFAANFQGGKLVIVAREVRSPV